MSNALNRHRLQPDAVLIHQTLGLFADSFEFDRASLTPGNLREHFQPLQGNETWRDIRDPLFASVGHDLDRLPAAWALGWSCAMSAPRRRIHAVGGFDEEFLGWGAEDIDLCYRLSKAGARFESVTDALCIHIPHVTVSRPVRETEHLANKLKLHRRRFELETELNVFLGGVGCNLLVPRLERFSYLNALPTYSSELLDEIRRRISGRLVVVGVPDARAIAALEAVAALVQSQHDLSSLERTLKSTDCLRSFGCATPYANAEFDAAVIGDAIRLFSRSLQVAQLRECARVARSTFLVCTKTEPSNHKVRMCECDGWGWSSIADLRAAADAAGATLNAVFESSGTVLFRLSISGAPCASEPVLVPEITG